MWTARGSLPADAYGSLFGGGTPAAASSGWVLNYFRWARQTGNLWAAALLPFLIILRSLPREVEHSAQANIYTLF